MNYTRIYFALVDRAKGRSLEGYHECHHIIPKCMGGVDDDCNLVKFTPEEHYLAHQLLVKMHPRNYHLLLAATMMTGKSSRILKRGNKLYGWLRRKLSVEQRGKKFSNEHRAALSAASAWKGKPSPNTGKTGSVPWNKGKKLSGLSEDHKQKIADALLGRKLSDVHRARISDNHWSKHR